jgi:hypothetical protein
MSEKSIPISSTGKISRAELTQIDSACAKQKACF